MKLTPAERALADSLDLDRLLLKDIRGLALELSRSNPSDWNKFLDVIIQWVVY